MYNLTVPDLTPFGSLYKMHQLLLSHTRCLDLDVYAAGPVGIMQRGERAQ